VTGPCLLIEHGDFGVPAFRFASYNHEMAGILLVALILLAFISGPMTWWLYFGGGAQLPLGPIQYFAYALPFCILQIFPAPLAEFYATYIAWWGGLGVFVDETQNEMTPLPVPVSD
jgi:hypothetical protein